MTIALTHTMITNARPGRDILYKLLKKSDFVEKENRQQRIA